MRVFTLSERIALLTSMRHIKKVADRFANKTNAGFFGTRHYVSQSALRRLFEAEKEISVIPRRKALPGGD